MSCQIAFACQVQHCVKGLTHVHLLSKSSTFARVNIWTPGPGMAFLTSRRSLAAIERAQITKIIRHKIDHSTTKTPNDTKKDSMTELHARSVSSPRTTIHSVTRREIFKQATTKAQTKMSLVGDRIAPLIAPEIARGDETRSAIEVR